MKKLLLLWLALLMTFSLTACTQEEPPEQIPTMDTLDFSEVRLEDCTDTDEVTDLVRMNVAYTNASGEYTTGDVVIRLYASVAPITVKNFQKLVKKGFYTNKTFHRVVPGFMIQGGAPTSAIEQATAIKGEFSSNGVENPLLHKRGVLSMARTQEPNSASSQFFIMLDEAPHLDGDYAAFGCVVYGMSTVDGIATTSLSMNYQMGEVSLPRNTVLIRYMTFVKHTSSGTTESTPETDTEPPITMDALDFSEVRLEDCTKSDAVTDLVRMNVTYTNAEGARVTGDVIIRLFAQAAPITVENFQTLVQNGFYNGTAFHRVVNGFMIQGGAPLAGQAPLTPIKGEFSANGVQNPLLHKRGVISMARTQYANSATSQFFIMHEAAPHLDGGYAAFGCVVFGMDTVDGIAATTVVANPQMDGEVSMPTESVVINYMSFVINQEPAAA